MEVIPQKAWQPVTPRGIAAFAHAPLRRLLLVQFIVALAVAGAVMWFVHDSYFPVINSAVKQLPAEGELRAGRLEWHSTSTEVLAENKFLSVSVDMDHSGLMRPLAHVQLEFGRTNLFIHSLLGYMEINYPNGWVIAANRTELEPAWGAWRPAILVTIGAGTVIWLFFSWAKLATLYAWPVWLLGFFANRSMDWRGSWRLSGAAMMPGALVMLVAISFYDLRVMDLAQMGFVFAAHFVIGWIYLCISPFFAQGLDDKKTHQGNPFSAGKS